MAYSLGRKGCGSNLMFSFLGDLFLSGGSIRRGFFSPVGPARGRFLLGCFLLSRKNRIPMIVEFLSASCVQDGHGVPFVSCIIRVASGRLQPESFRSQ